MTEEQVNEICKAKNRQIMMNSMRLDEETAKIVRDIVRSCKTGMDDWEKCQHILLIRKFFLYALTKSVDHPDHVLWYWEDENSVYWYLLKGNWDRTCNPFWGAGLVEDGNKKFPQDVQGEFKIPLAGGGGFVGNLDFIRASIRAIQLDTPDAWQSAEEVWRKMYPLNSTLPLPPKGISGSMKIGILKNQCNDEIAKWALAHRTAIKNSMRARGFGNSGCLNGAIEDLGEHCKWMRSIISQAVETLASGDSVKAMALIDTLKCGPTACPMPQGSHNGDCLEIARSKMTGLFLASSIKVPVSIKISPSSVNPERERLLANEMFARGIHAAAEARKEGFSVPDEFEKSWADVCGGLACASRDGWKAFATAVDRETGCIVPDGMYEHPYDTLISRLKQVIITNEMVVKLVQALQPDATSPNSESILESSNNAPSKPRHKRTQKGETPDWIPAVLLLLKQNPGISGAEAARRVGVSKSTLTQHPTWRRAVAAYQSGKPIVTQFQKRGGVRKKLSNAQSNDENEILDENS